MIKKSNFSDLVTTNRFINNKALSDWPFYRKFLTTLRHFIIKSILLMPYDSTGAFRCYNVRNIKLNDILLAKDNGYSFFWESLFIFYKKKFIIKEIAVNLPGRLAGTSKMKFTDIFNALFYLVKIYLKN